MEKSKRPPAARRPGSVIVAGWFAILAVPLILTRITILLLQGELAAVATQTLNDPAVLITPQGLEALALALVLPIALTSLITGIAILWLKRWAWVVLMTFLVVALVVNLIRGYFHEPEYWLMLIYAALTLLLNQPEVRQAFRIGRPSHEPVE